jgi:hypothetical protein
MSRRPPEFQQEQFFIPHAAGATENSFDGGVDRFDYTEPNGMEAVSGDALEMTGGKLPEALHLGQPLPPQGV